MMEFKDLLQAATAVAICVGGWFFKRIFKVLDQYVDKTNNLEIDVARIKVENTGMNNRLDRIEGKIDKLLERNE
jgi:chaperonin cofactor prefoldin